MVRARCATAMGAMARQPPLLVHVMLGMILPIRAQLVLFAELVNTRLLPTMLHVLRALPTTLDAVVHLLVFVMLDMAVQMEWLARFVLLAQVTR